MSESPSKPSKVSLRRSRADRPGFVGSAGHWNNGRTRSACTSGTSDGRPATQDLPALSVISRLTW